ncbi:MAG: hypothetical protein KC766_20250 [Myxococcales bacterium]|nr:hypothetical protein [Myxococcales bacterium]
MRLTTERDLTETEELLFVWRARQRVSQTVGGIIMHWKSLSRWCGVIAASWFGVMGCSSSSTNETARECTSGEVASCEHQSGCVAQKACDGKVFGSCECVGAGGSSGNGGSAGNGNGGVGGAGATSGASSGGSTTGGVGATGGAAGSSGSAGVGGTGGGGGCTGTQELCGGSCVELDNDAKHCGRCGHDCLAGTCSDGKCQRFTLASPKDPIGITADDTTVFWVDADAGEIQSAPRGTANQHNTLATGLTNPFAVVIQDSDLIFIEKATNGRVRRIPKAGGTPVGIAGSQVTPSALAADASSIYWGLEGTDQITDGTDTRPASNPQGIAIDAAGVFFTTFTEGSIRRAPRDLGAAQPTAELIASQTKPTAITVNATHVFWVNRDPSGGVYSLPKAGGPLITLDTTDTPYDVEVDASHAYWLTRESGGQLRRRGLSSGAVETLATGLGAVHSLVITSDALYWTVQHATNARVQGLAKP